MLSWRERDADVKPRPMEDAAAQLARLADATSSAPRVGVCVTGEARSFALRGVRASLHELLAQFEEPALRMILARRGSATGRRNSITGGQSSDVIQTRIRGGPIGAVGAARDPSAVLRPETEAETDEARETRASMFRV